MHKEKEVSDPSVSTEYHKISQVRFLTDETFVIRLERGDIQFKPGQRIIVGLKEALDLREYSIYSGEKDDYLELLVREVLRGNVSPRLKNCKPGDLLQVNGPFGSFGIEPFDLSRKLVFIATGTGISPFHSFVRSYPEIDYTIIHGVSHKAEAYGSNEYEPSRYILCTSKETNEGRKGRVTKFLPGFPLKPEMLFYLCGNNSMIYEVYHILRNRGVPDEKIFMEVYF